jgi:hypothetical protein
MEAAIAEGGLRDILDPGDAGKTRVRIRVKMASFFMV